MSSRPDEQLPTLVLLSGLGCDGRLWQAVRPALEERFDLLVPSIAGRGSLATAAEAVLADLDAREIQAVGVAGLSMGGYVLFELLKVAPERIRAAAFLDTTAFPDDPERQDKRRQVLRLLDAGRFPEVLDRFVASVLGPEASPAGSAARLLASMARDQGAEVFTRDSRAILARGAYQDLLGLLRVPALFVSGEFDALTPPEIARRMALAVPGARVEVLPGAGHMTPLEAPEPLGRVLADFFSGALKGTG